MSEASEEKKKLPLPVIIGVVVALVGGGTFFFGQRVGAGTAKPKEEPPGHRLKLEEMVVNLKDRDQFIKASPEVEFKKPGQGEASSKEFEAYVSRIEGAITLVFRSTPVEKLGSWEGIEQVERQMVTKINTAIKEPTGQVKDVTLGKFATQ